MNYLKELSEKVNTVKLSIDDLVSNTIDNNDVQIRKWITDRWLTGKDSNGDLIGLYRSESYANEKYNISSLAGFSNVDLTYTGLMGRSIQLSGFNNEFEVFSTVGYYDDITDKYGDINFNITDAEKEKLNDIIFMVIFNEINEAYE